ncbi:MAG: hypothetical protein ACD_2C00169G0001 [uncultured bacterium (gcode 4)]|uniref:Uncharacterized protein n=1 Tax=uncultured bacterium (gcode 4) TaxID=1234023 RepID=K2GGD1_9BACT|nr:MAG: hypothetical protein ACD_2C00169G0001 [uncultured bacterium (gcode 4)]
MNQITEFIIVFIPFLYQSSPHPPHTILKNAIIAIAMKIKDVTTSRSLIIGIIRLAVMSTAVAVHIFLLKMVSTAAKDICISRIHIVVHSIQILHFLKSSSVHCQ